MQQTYKRRPMPKSDFNKVAPAKEKQTFQLLHFDPSGAVFLFFITIITKETGKTTSRLTDFYDDIWYLIKIQPIPTHLIHKGVITFKVIG